MGDLNNSNPKPQSQANGATTVINALITNYVKLAKTENLDLTVFTNKLGNFLRTYTGKFNHDQIATLKKSIPFHILINAACAHGSIAEIQQLTASNTNNLITILAIDNHSALRMACKNGAVIVINALLKAYNFSSYSGNIDNDHLILRIVCESNNLALVTQLLDTYNSHVQKNIVLTKKNISAESILDWATTNSSQPILQFILSLCQPPASAPQFTNQTLNKRTINTDYLGNSLLHTLVYENELKKIKQLLSSVNDDDKFAIFNTRNAFGMTPLHLAAHIGKINIVNALLDSCTDDLKMVITTTLNSEDLTALQIAALNNHTEVVAALENINSSQHPPFSKRIRLN